jgi:hypothetical protein
MGHPSSASVIGNRTRLHGLQVDGIMVYALSDPSTNRRRCFLPKRWLPAALPGRPADMLRPPISESHIAHAVNARALGFALPQRRHLEAGENGDDRGPYHQTQSA